MGTDIHWTTEYFDGSCWVFDSEASVYEGRNYRLFAALAGVRNGIGFAGCDMGDPIVPIAEPRGLPPDVSSDVRAIHDDTYRDEDAAEDDHWWLGDHSFTWLTLDEILRHDWTQTIITRGVVNGPQFFAWGGHAHEWSPTHAPASYCGDISGASIRHVSASEMKSAVWTLRPLSGNWGAWSAGVTEALAGTYCRVQWLPTLASECAGFWCDFMPRAISYGFMRGGFDRVRYVFGFDS